MLPFSVYGHDYLLFELLKLEIYDCWIQAASVCPQWCQCVCIVAVRLLDKVHRVSEAVGSCLQQVNNRIECRYEDIGELAVVKLDREWMGYCRV